MELFGRILIVLFFATGASAQLPSQDILALLAFKKGITHDPTGYISKSWNEEAINFNGCPRSWNGIVCDGTSIAGVVIDNLGLTGTIDLSVLANLTMLIKLSLSGNNFTGRLPDNVANFVRLKHLDLSDNLFSGVLPGDIGRLRSLQNLSLAWNNFSGPLPPSIGRLASMLSLDFSHNLFSGPLPSTLKDLKNLVSLNFSNNVLEGKIPTRLDEIPTLQSLDLSWNQFDGAVDWYFLMQSSAVYVDLSGNLLSSSGPKELKYLSEVSETVKYLNLSNNQLTGSLIDATEVSTFGSLRMLDLSSNQLSGELPRFDYVYELEVLKLRNNGISGAVPDALLKGDSLVLNELDLSANNLSGHIGLITSATLQTLNLSSNAISGGLPLLTGSCVVLDLSKNQFGGNLSVIEKWGNDIEYIDLSQNQLMGPIPGITSEFLRLNYLNLSHNVLMGTLPQVIVKYPKLNVLDISFNKFTGPILIDLLTSPTLQELYIQYNILEGSIMFPPLTKKSNLQILNLSGNRFNGSFPDDLVSLTGLQILDMSVNNFTGPLPPSIAELTSLISLDMSLNHFTGPLPATLSDTLVAFNASYNDLSGVVPANLRKFPDSSFHPGNIMLEFPSLSPVSANAPFGGPSQKSNKVFIHATIIAAGIIVVVILTLLCIFLHYKRISSSHSERITDRKTQICMPSATGVKGRDRDGTIVVSADDLIAPRKGSSDVISPEEKMGAVAGFSPSKGSCFSWSPESGETCPHDLGRFDVRSPDRLAGDLYFLDETITLSPEELARAPAEVLGRSSHGTSYRATLDNGVFLTVKWLREGVAKPKKEFSKEAKKFANIRHPNVVGLRGYYWGPTAHEKLILSDYIAPGNLANVLYDRPERKALPLNWAQRLKIAVDVARGLNYLHFDRAIPHGNLKATNILLDGLDLNARVADYCLHRLMTQSGTVEQIHDLGLLGYCAPELAASKKPVPSFKSDVYAFGVVLLELLTGRCAADQISGEEGEAHMTDWIRMRVAESHETDCLDPAMAPDIVNPAAAKGMKEMMEIAMRCIRPLSERPGIKSVYEDLSSI